LITNLQDLILAVGIGILGIWNLILLLIHFAKEGNEGSFGTRIIVFIVMLLLYVKQLIIAGLGVYALALGTATVPGDSFLNWFIAMLLFAFFVYMMYMAYPRFINEDLKPGKQYNRKHKKRTRL
jgi:hypothetical protein